MCAFHEEAHSYGDVETLKGDLPSVKIKGILPFDFDTTTNRTMEMYSLRPTNMLDHCYLTEEFITDYQIVWRAWQQLALDYSVCLGSTFYKRESENRLADIVNNIRTNISQDIDYEAIDILYVHDSYVPRNEVENYDDLQLNFFCNRIIYLYDNYQKDWNIMKQLEIDLLGCYMITNTRIPEKFVRANFSNAVMISQPKIIVKSELLFNQDANKSRGTMLKALGPEKLQKHCNKTTQLLKDYKEFWKTIDQMSEDANYCNLYIYDQISYDNTPTNAISELPMKIYSSNLEHVIATCKEVAIIFMEQWRQEPNNFHLIKSLKTCFWKLTQNILCVSTDRLNNFENDAQDLFITLKDFDWENFRKLTATDVTRFCTTQISQMRHLYLSAEDQKTLTKNLEICIHVLSRNQSILQTEADYYYIAGNKIISMQDNLPECNNTIATVLKILFPNTYLEEMYQSRSMNNRDEFDKTFEVEWNKKRLDKFYFTSACNENVDNDSICNTLSLITNESSVPEFCSKVTESIKNLTRIQKSPLDTITQLRHCLVLTLCPGVNCANLTYKRSTMVEDSSVELINSILHSNWKNETTSSILGVISNFNKTFNNESPIKSG